VIEVSKEVLKIAENIQSILDGKNPMYKWECHTGVKNLDDLEWLIKSNLRECLILQGSQNAKGETDMEDWVLGKQAAFTLCLANLQNVRRNLNNGQN